MSSITEVPQRRKNKENKLISNAHRLMIGVTFDFSFRIPEIIEAFDHPSKELLNRLKEEVERFSREGETYWIVKVTITESCS